LAKKGSKDDCSTSSSTHTAVSGTDSSEKGSASKQAHDSAEVKPLIK